MSLCFLVAGAEQNVFAEGKPTFVAICYGLAVITGHQLNRITEDFSYDRTRLYQEGPLTS